VKLSFSNENIMWNIKYLSKQKGAPEMLRGIV
jgi:hypothetical protein